MAAGDRLIDDDGTFLVGSTGTALVKDGDDECPECCDGCPCTDHDNLSIKITFANVVACSGCLAAYINGATVSINGTYNLTFLSGDATSSTYTVTIPNAVSYDFYDSESDCINEVDGTPITNDAIVWVEVKCISNNITGVQTFAFEDDQGHELFVNNEAIQYCSVLNNEQTCGSTSVEISETGTALVELQ